MPNYFANLPPVVMVGPYEIHIKIVPKVDKSNSHGEYARTTYGGVIRLKRDHDTRTQALDTVKHELLHAIWDKAEINPAFEEDAVSKIATWDTNILMANQKLASWMAKCILG
jgi:hypothetical protein